MVDDRRGGRDLGPVRGGAAQQIAHEGPETYAELASPVTAGAVHTAAESVRTANAVVHGKPGEAGRHYAKATASSIATGLALAGPELGELGAVAKPRIGATGKLGEAALKQLGGESQVYFRTSLGGRFIDQLVNGVAHESKVGYMSLTKKLAVQIAKDAELIQTGQIRGAVWHFFKSPVTNRVGPSAQLLRALTKAGIKAVIH